jgi:hypothetical protein
VSPSLVDKATEFHARDDVIFDDEPEFANEDWSRQVSADYSGDPYYQELKTTIEDLEPDQQVMLVALMWLGRGDYSMVEWDAALAHAEDSWNEHSADYLIGTAMLGEYFSEGLQQFETEAAEEE